MATIKLLLVTTLIQMVSAKTTKAIMRFAFNSVRVQIWQQPWPGQLPYFCLLSLAPAALQNLSVVAGLEGKASGR